MACRSGCRVGSHKTWGECARDANLQIDRHGLAGHRTAERKKDRRLDTYRSLRESGVQPKSTRLADVRAAEESGGVPPSTVINT